VASPRACPPGIPLLGYNPAMTNSPYQPSAQILEKYAAVLVNFALNSGAGVKAGEVVNCAVPDIAKPLALALQNAVLKAGAHLVMQLLPTGFEKDYFQLANEKQLEFFPKKYFEARAALFDHQIGIIADPDPKELSEIDPQKIFTVRNTRKRYRDWLIAKENAGKFTWTCALWGVEAKAKEVGLSLEEYWQEIIKACFLDKADPVQHWRAIMAEQQHIRESLNAMKIQWIHAVGPDMDLKLKIGSERIWNGGSGRNIPSFEIFTSPDWRGTEGWIAFNQPLYRYGNVVKGIRLEFHKGLITKAHAEVGNSLLQGMLKTENANKLGEYSLTDKRFSRISHVMAETLFDENIGGPFGNTHVAIGMSYRDCYVGDSTKITKAGWKRMGYNDSAEHTDMISTVDRTVTATLADGTEKLIYSEGQFQI
jgi:aminopeptidase